MFQNKSIFSLNRSNKEILILKIFPPGNQELICHVTALNNEIYNCKTTSWHFIDVTCRAEAVAKPHGSFVRTLLGHSLNRVATVTVAYCQRARAGATDGRLWGGDSNVHTRRSKGGRIHITRCSALARELYLLGARVPSLFPAAVIWAASLHLTPCPVTQQVCSRVHNLVVRPQSDIIASLVKAPHCIFTRQYFLMVNNHNNRCIWRHPTTFDRVQLWFDL